MADVKPIPPPLSPISPIRSVLFAPPPAELIPSIRASLDRSVAALAPGSKGGAFLIATRLPTGQVNANLALVTVLPRNWTIDLYVAKTWGSTVATDYHGDGFEAGVKVMKTW